MDSIIPRYCLYLLLLTSVTTSAGNNETNDDSREPRVIGRIVKLYSGAKPDPYLCSGEGFQADPNSCTAFFRCVKERSGKFSVFRYQCAPGTVYDPDLETCNHPHSTRRTECGGTLKSTTESHLATNINEIDGAQSEIPRPISTKLPVYTEQTNIKNPTTLSWILSTERQPPVQTTLTSTIINSPSMQITSSPKLPASNNNQWVSSTQKWESQYTSNTPHKPTQSSNNNELCTSDGFMGDSENCRKFYRCVGNQQGGYMKYEFSCSESTVWDDEIQGCNHPWAVKKSKCGRSLTYSDKSTPQDSDGLTSTMEISTTKNPNVNNEEYIKKSNKTIQHQLQISHGSQVTQTQTQISNSPDVIQNQTQINYGDKISSISESKQNQTQISNGTAVSQSQTQINYGNNGMQSQLQIDHSKDSSQYQVQILGSTTQSTASNPINNNNKNNKCSDSGFMGDTDDCKKFYRCVDNGKGSYTKYEYTCGEGTVWDQEIEACNHAWAVKNCGAKQPSSSTTGSQTSTTTVKTTEYHTEYTKTTQSHITSSVSDVDDEDDVGYGNQNNQEVTSIPTTVTKITTTTVKSTSLSSSKPNTGTNCATSGFMGDENDCKIFYRCVDNGNNGFTKYEFKCGDGTVWDPNIEACNHAWAVKHCGGSATGSAEKEEITTKKENITPLENIHTTVTLIQISTETPTQDDDYDTGYGSQNNDQQQISTLSTSTTSKYVTQSQGQGTMSNSDCQTSGFMGDKNDCKKFYRCVDNGNAGYIKYEFTCGQGTVWDPKIDACNHAWAVEKCGGSNNLNEVEFESSSQLSPTTNSNGINNIQTTQVSKETDKPSVSSTIKSPTTTVGKDNKCSDSGFMADVNDCKKFYRCVDNGDGSYTRYEFTCGEGTVWDTKNEVCNHAWAVEKCGNNADSSWTHETQQTTSQHPVIQDEEESGYATPSFETSSTSQSTSVTSSNSISTSSQSKPSLCTSSGFMADKKDCKKFYRCVENGRGGYDIYEFHCGEGTAWDENIEACNHAREVKGCGESEPSSTNFQSESTSQYTTSTEQTIFTETTKKPENYKGTCNSEGFYANPSDCKKFYRCVANGNGGYTKYDFTCGDGTVWNQENQGCDHESSDKSCTSTSSIKPHTTESQSESTTSFSSTTKKQETTDKTETSETTESRCASEGFMAHPNNCKKFIRCVDNGNGGFTPYEFSCGQGTVWVQEIQACDHDNDVNSCGSKEESSSQSANTEIIPSSTSASITSSPENIPSNDQYDPHAPNEPSHDEIDDCTAEGFFANKQDCKKFYRCVDNGNGVYTKYNFVCGEGTAWDSDLQTCNHINKVNGCSESTSENDDNGNQSTSTTSKNQAQSESTTSSTTKATTSAGSSGSSHSKDKCENEGYYGDSNDCKKFYRCVDNGKGGYTKYDYTCGEGTIWDQDITTCNHPQDVSNPSCNSSQGTSDQSSTTSSTTSSSQTTSTSSTTESSSTSQNTSDCSQETSKKPGNNNVTCDKAGFYPNPNDCKKFYRCVDWDGDGKRFSVFHFECGEGTIWDPALDTCNHEDSVYPPRDCQTQSQNVGGETTTTSSSTTSTTEYSTSEQTTQESSTEQTTAQQASSENTTTEGANQQTTTEQSSTSEKTTTTQESTTSEQTTTEQSVTSEQTTTQQSPTSEQTTTQQSTTSEQTTTQQSTTSEQTTTQQSTTSEQTTTQQSTSSEQTTTQQSTTSEQTTTQQSTTSEQTTVQQSTTSEQTTTQQTTEQPATGEPTTTEQTTTQQSTTAEQTTTQQPITEQTTTHELSTTEQTTTQQSTTDEQTTAQQSTTTDQTTTQESTTNTQGTEQSTTTEETTQQTTTSENTTTEHSSESTTEQTSTTTEQTTDGTSTADYNTDGTTTTQTSSTESDSTEEPSSTTEASSSDKECPETEDGQYVLVCPTSFRRHPKYCNMFYQCTEEDDTYEAKVAMFKCPNNTIYDETKTQCVTEDKADEKCNGEIANKRRFKRLGSNYKEPIVADKGRHKCSSTGYFPFEKHSECAKGFMKCVKNKNGELEGYVYQCPDGYVYWSISKRCERIESVRDCKRSSNDWTGRWNIPIERKNVAIR